MDDLTKYLGSLAIIGAAILTLFKAIYYLGKKDQKNEIENEIEKFNKAKIKKIIATKNWLRNMPDNKLSSLLRKKK